MEPWEKAEHNPKGLDVVRVGGSGSGVIKGDQIGAHLMVEIKTTEKMSFRISLELIDKLKRQAASMSRMPILRVDLDVLGRDESVAVMPWSEYVVLMDVIDDCE